PDILRAPTKKRRHYSMPQPRRRRHGPQPDRRRALELLAASPDGCTEAMLRAHGFSTAQMVDLVRAGLATAHSQRVISRRARSSAATGSVISPLLLQPIPLRHRQLTGTHSYKGYATRVTSRDETSNSNTGPLTTNPSFFPSSHLNSQTSRLK